MRLNYRKILVTIILIVIIILSVILYFYDNKKTEDVNNVVSSTVEETSVELEAEDYVTDYENETTINLDDLTYDGEGVEIDGNIITIVGSGDFYLTGSNTAQIIVDTDSKVHLVLDNVDLYYSDSAPIYIKNAKKVIITLKEGSTNIIKDGNNYEVNADEEPNATIFSKDDLVINGSGSLEIESNYEDGIASKDTLKIIDTSITITANDDGIRGKDYIYIVGSTIDVISISDGIKSTNDSNSSLGFINIKDSTITINSSKDAIQAETNLYIENSTLDITTTGSISSNSSWNTDTTSSKGLKATNNIVIDGGTYNINSTDDSIHSNNSIVIELGTFNISSSDDGIHADTQIVINDGSITISKSYEGIESAEITINSGVINITASDDGINGAGGADSSSTQDRQGQNNFSTSTGTLYINGGNIYVVAVGDGIDINGSIYMTTGIVIVNGPTDDGNGSLDYDGDFEITGGTLIASGSSGMAQMPTSNSSQNSVMINFTTTISANSTISILDSEGNEVITYKASKKYVNLVISSSLLTNGAYTININGTSTSNETNGLYETGGYIKNTDYKTFTISSINTTVGTVSSNGPTGGSQQRR